MDAVSGGNEETLPRPKISSHGREAKANTQTQETQQGLAFVFTPSLPLLSVTWRLRRR